LEGNNNSPTNEQNEVLFGVRDQSLKKRNREMTCHMISEVKTRLDASTLDGGNLAKKEGLANGKRSATERGRCSEIQN